jgi:hypothetical protein
VTAEIDIDNSQMVGARADHVVVVMPRDWMTPTEALVHAAWLVTIAEAADLLAAPRDGTWKPLVFDDIRHEVRNT